MYVYIYILYTYIYVYMYIYIYIICIHIYIYTYTLYIYINIDIDIDIYVYKCANIYIWLYICILLALPQPRCIYWNDSFSIVYILQRLNQHRAYIAMPHVVVFHTWTCVPYIIHARVIALCTPKAWLPTRVPKEEFGRMIFEKNLPWRTVLKFSQRRRQLPVEVRRGAGTCDDPCILACYCSSTSL